MNPVFGPNLVDDIRQMFEFHFMVNALRAGTIVALVAGPIGYLMVLRRQSFAGHTLSVIGFPGAAGATWLGLNATAGYFTFCIAGAIIIALFSGSRSSSPSGQGDSALIGVVQAFALACGFLFISLYHGYLEGMNTLLFGSITGIADSQVVVLAVSAVIALVVVALIWRRVVFSSVDPVVAATRGVNERLTSVVFLVLLAIAVAGTSQITGSLLTFALLIAPAAAAARLTGRPGLGAILATVIALVVVWAGETAAYYSPYPIGFWVSTFAFAAFLLALIYRGVLDARGRRAVGRRRESVTGALG
ncbi:metal ABC transporter permease [Gordonia jinhuaensis]|uniref:High-affinity zinc uptake system membrane protein ZnuB n=1 Tax=Gordonia jinhuaensis TaxID=1517702 RepID=A0A916WT26_9ACTN|nr:metal ABC transporter permease [Gordonia jinhuaensis]GGB32101.1 zinc ABC transporter permease [Gordonia jinhuaensis]